MSNKVTKFAVAFASLLGIATLTSSNADARTQIVDRRGVPPVVGQAKPTENFAIQSGWRVKCVLPFCGHDFNPSRERSRDHRSHPGKKPR
jgi:hypothetical protein